MPKPAMCYPGSAYSAEEIVWLKAVEAFRRRTRQVTLDARDVLAIAAALGYRKEPAPVQQSDAQ